MTSGTVLLAHQGGWDEILLVAAPIGLFVLLLWVANNRAAHHEDPQHGEGTGAAAPAAEHTPDEPGPR